MLAAWVHRNGWRQAAASAGGELAGAPLAGGQPFFSGTAHSSLDMALPWHGLCSRVP